MKLFKPTWLAVAAFLSWAAPVEAQYDWNQPDEIGSYQSILAKGGMGGTTGVGASHQPINQMSYDQTASQPIALPAGMNSDAGFAGGEYDGAWNGHPPYSGQLGAGHAGRPHQGFHQPGIGENPWLDQSQCGAGVGGAGLAIAEGQSANWVLGTRALFFTRSNESGVPLTRNDLGDVLWSNDNSYGTMQGGEVSLTRRSCSNRGLEFRYWGLFPSSRESFIYPPMLDTYLTGFNDYVIAPGAVNLADVYNNADSNFIIRRNRFHNAEVNFLRNVGVFESPLGRSSSYEWLGGFRWFQFDEDFRFTAMSATLDPMRVDYDLQTRNTLLGFQLGGRNEICLTERFSLIGGTRFGIFNNRVRARQMISNGTGEFAYLAGGTPGVDDFNFRSSEDRLALLGELDLGVAYRFHQNVRLNVGYRVLGINGVALAPNQIPRNFTNVNEINRINADSSLILGGAYGGLDFAF